MTGAEVRDLFGYNAWANRKLFDAAAQLPDEAYLRDLKSSFGGVHGTLCHIAWAEHLWLTRWRGAPPPVVPQGRDLASLGAVRARWEEVEAERARFLAGYSDAQLEDTREVRPTTGGAFSHTFREMFLHVVDHSSYHRGQVVTMIRQLGHVPPATNLIYYYREHGDRGRPIPRPDGSG